LNPKGKVLGFSVETDKQRARPPLLRVSLHFILSIGSWFALRDILLLIYVEDL
jgi:hypothetical protein